MNTKVFVLILLISTAHVAICSPPTTESLLDSSHNSRKPRLGILRRVGHAVMYGILPRCATRSNTEIDLDDWTVVSDPELHARTVVEASQDVLKREMSKLTGESSNHDRSKVLNADPIAALEHSREELWAHMGRMCEDYGNIYEETIRVNFDRFDNFDPKSVYLHLGYRNEEAYPLSHERFDALIRQREKESSDDTEKKLMRQCGFLFRNQTTKHLYDAYLQGGSVAIGNLSIEDPDDVEHIRVLMEMSVEAKAELEEHRRSVAREVERQNAASVKKKKKKRCIIS